jgi:hypothetical protein
LEGFKGHRGEFTLNEVKYLQIVNAAVAFAMNPGYLGRLIGEGRIPAIQDEQKRIWVAEAELKKWVDNRAQAAAGRTPRVGGAGGKKHPYQYVPNRIKILKGAKAIVNAATSDDLDEQSKMDVIAYIDRLLSAEIGKYLDEMAKRKGTEAAASTGPGDPNTAVAAADAATADADFMAALSSEGDEADEDLDEEPAEPAQ